MRFNYEGPAAKFKSASVYLQGVEKLIAKRWSEFERFNTLRKRCPLTYIVSPSRGDQREGAGVENKVFNNLLSSFSDVIGSWESTIRVFPYGIGLGPGVGATSQMADAQSGKGLGAGTWKSLPWVVANPPDMQVPE